MSIVIPNAWRAAPGVRNLPAAAEFSQAAGTSL